MKKRTQQGFTLYELLITFLVVGVILTLGIPNMKAFTQNSRMTATANDLLSAFQAARSESARAKTNIGICASADPFGAPACDGTWDQGYIVYVENSDPPDLTVGNAANESVLRAHGPIAEGVSLSAEGGATYFMYASTGLGRTVAGATPLTRVIMCDSRGNVTAAGGNSAARLFVATPLGRTTIVRETAQISASGLACP
jgi:type IV fimbrial biogenesis protein FimT